MSRSLNQVCLIGNLTRDPEMRASPTGTEVCQFSLALNHSYRTREGEEVESVSYVDVSAWGGLARVVQDYCHKGKQVFVGGRLRSSSWEQDGQKRSKLSVVAENIILLGGGSREDDGGRRSQSKPASKKETKEEIDYEGKDADYELEGLNPEDIPF